MLRKIFNVMVYMMGKFMVVWVDDEVGKRMVEVFFKFMWFMVGKDVFFEKGVILMIVVYLFIFEILWRLFI